MFRWYSLSININQKGTQGYKDTFKAIMVLIGFRIKRFTVAKETQRFKALYTFFEYRCNIHFIIYKKPTAEK